jgi:hypothetical protein
MTAPDPPSAPVPPVSPAENLTARPQRIGSNIIFSGLGRAWSAILLFVNIPIVVHGIGTAAYGVFTLTSADGPRDARGPRGQLASPA